MLTSRCVGLGPSVARKLIELANAVEPVQDGRIYIELLNGPFPIQGPARRPNTAPV
jgi:hypothetical protein